MGEDHQDAPEGTYTFNKLWTQQRREGVQRDANGGQFHRLALSVLPDVQRDEAVERAFVDNYVIRYEVCGQPLAPVRAEQ